MMRILVDIPETDLLRLDALAKTQKTSRARLIREAVETYLAQNLPDPIETSLGLWRDRAEDGVSYQKRLRDES